MYPQRHVQICMMRAAAVAASALCVFCFTGIGSAVADEDCRSDIASFLRLQSAEGGPLPISLQAQDVPRQHRATNLVSSRPSKHLSEEPPERPSGIKPLKWFTRPFQGTCCMHYNLCIVFSYIGVVLHWCVLAVVGLVDLTVSSGLWFMWLAQTCIQSCRGAQLLLIIRRKNVKNL